MGFQERELVGRKREIEWGGREGENMNMNIAVTLSLEKTANSSLNPSRLWRC